MAQSVTKGTLKRALLKQLEDKGRKEIHYLDLVNDYISMWEIKNALLEDIDERGVSVKYNNGGGQEGWKKNDSISELHRTNSQMLKILSDLGLKASELEFEDEDEEM